MAARRHVAMGGARLLILGRLILGEYRAESAEGRVVLCDGGVERLDLRVANDGRATEGVERDT